MRACACVFLQDVVKSGGEWISSIGRCPLCVVQQPHAQGSATRLYVMGALAVSDPYASSPAPALQRLRTLPWVTSTWLRLQWWPYLTHAGGRGPCSLWCSSKVRGTPCCVCYPSHTTQLSACQSLPSFATPTVCVSTWLVLAGLQGEDTTHEAVKASLYK